MAETKEPRKFGLIDKLAYAAGDFGCNMSFALKGTMTLFWTQFMGIDTIVMAGLTLVTQVWDAINDPLIGAMVDADRHKYARNKFLQYIWFGSIGLTVAGALCFIPLPGLPSLAKNLVYIAGYVIWDAFYTIANVPYGSMLSLITTDTAERAQLSTFRSLGATIAGVITGAVLPMIIYDENSVLLGGRIWMVALVMGIIGFICFQFMIRNTVIRVDTEVNVNEDAPKFNVFVAIKNFVRNRPAVGATLIPVGMFLGMYGAGTASTVMFQAYFNAARFSGLFSMIGQLGIVFFVPFITPLVRKIGKKEGVTIGATVSCVAYLLMLFLPITPDLKGLIMYAVCQVIAAIGNGFSNCVLYSMMADAIDYEEWKFGVRNEGTTYALHSFFRKLAQGVGPSIGLVAATALGYVATLGPAQTPEVAHNMLKLTGGMYLLSAVIQLVAVTLIYNLDKKTLAQMQSDLAARHAKKA